MIPAGYIRQVLLRGSGFAGGKGRICKIYENEFDAGTRAKEIRKEYGMGGAGWPIEGYGLHGYDTFKGSGIRLQWRDEEGEKEGYVSWRTVEEEIGALIMTGEYRPEVSEQILDDFAIPDEPESYDSVRRNELEQYDALENEDILENELTDEELAIEDQMVTMAEYSEELENEKQKDETDVSYVVPADKSGGPVPEKRNYHYNLWDLPIGGAKTRYKWNIEAIKLLKTLETEGRLAGYEEQKVLSKYAGWGGIPQAFDDKNSEWEKEYAELHALLNDEEYAAARATVNNAFYTSPVICTCINRALVSFGFHGGNLLEPSMGTGNFFGSLPAGRRSANLYGVELDPISGRIARQLYQTANITIGGFEHTEYPDNFFDVAVGNVPFGDYKVFDKKYNKYNFRIHDYFLAKALDQVRPGGIVAFATTKGTLDKSNPAIRQYLAQRAELIGAVRLPNTAFKDNAGTEVTCDILFLQKRERKMDVEPDWVHLGYTDDGIPINSYYVEHPEMVLGHMEYDKRIYGKDSRYTTCVNLDPEFNLYEALNEAVQNMHAELTEFERLEETEEKGENIIPTDPDVRNFSFCFVDGKLYYRENSQMYRREV